MPFSVLPHSVYDSFKKLMYFAKDIMVRVCTETKVKSCRTNNKKVVGRNFENKKRAFLRHSCLKSFLLMSH